MSEESTGNYEAGADGADKDPLQKPLGTHSNCDGNIIAPEHPSPPRTPPLPTSIIFLRSCSISASLPSIKIFAAASTFGHS